MEKLTDDERLALKQFKVNVADVLCADTDKDPHLIKGLRARNFNVQKAEKYFREVHAFKKLYEYDSTLYQIPEMAEKYEWTAFLGHAKDGTIVRYTAAGRGDHIGFVSSMSGFDLCLYASHTMESDLARQRKYNRENGKQISEITYIFDLDGFAITDIMHKCVLETVLDLLYLVQEYYWDVWQRILFVNAPSYFDVAFNIFKPILRLNVLQKLRVVSREATAELLLKYIDSDVLPQFLGGKRVDCNGDPQCREFLRFGGTIPPRHYLLEHPCPASSDQGATVREIAARTSLDLPIRVRDPSSRIRIQFRTENGSIHMRILFRESVTSEEEEGASDSSLRMVSPPLRVQSHLAHVDHTVMAPWTGTYVFRFNNSHSWFLSRRLIYRITLMEPDSRGI